MGRVKVIALKRRREPDFDSERWLAILFVLIALLFLASRASAQPGNDNACNATVINVGLNSPFTNVNATSQFGEPAIPTGTCTAQGVWCSGETAPQLSHTVWFKFTVPANGTGSYAFRVNGTAATFDSQIALFSAATCADLTNGNAIRLGANDDSTSSLFNSYMTVFCLTPTVTYYILVDGYGTTTSSSFYVHVVELPDRNAVANAGSDQTICYSLFPQFPVNGTVLGVAGSTAWTTTGDGTFASPSALNTTYSPGPNDKSTGVTRLILSTNDPVGACGASKDTMVLTIIADSITGGPDKTICNNEESVTMSGQAFLFTSYQWTTTGDGAFDNPALLNANYFPGPNDRLHAFTNVVLRGVSTQCFNTVYDTVRISNSPAAGATVNLGNDSIVCYGNAIALTAQQLSGYSTLQWTTSGNGIFSNPTSSSTTYTPGSLDLNNGVVTVTLSAQGVTPCQGIKSDSKQLFLQKPPVVQSISGGGSYCSSSTITLNADITDYNNLQWTTSGDGTFTAANDLQTIYIPGTGDLNNGFVSVTINATAITPCAAAASQSVNITLTKAPVVSITVPPVSCASGAISLNASVTNYQTLNWSGGDGSFDDASSSKPKYIPGALDILSGSAAFTVTVFGNAPCNAFIAHGTTTLIPDPSVTASAPSTVCTGNTVAVNAVVTHASAVAWDTDGDGFFTNPASASSIYIPGSGDYATGEVNLFISVDGVNPCTSNDNDAVHITFINHASADAGPDDDVVAGQSAALDGFVENSASHNWTTSGDGTFNSSILLNAVYTPGPNDIANGSVLLTLHALDISPCAVSTSDAVEISIYPDALLAVKLYIEGMYTFPGNYPSLYTGGFSNSPASSDTVIFNFHGASSPYPLQGSYPAILGSNGIAVVSLPGSYAGSSYYVAVKHRNALETWTHSPVTIGSFGLIDFTAQPVLRSSGSSSAQKENPSLK
jgi:hypothetical protein